MNCGKRMGRMKETKKFKDNWQKYFGPGAGNRSGISDLVFGRRMEMVSAYVLPLPGAGVDELFKNGENRGTVAGYFNQFPACHEGICDCVPVCLCAGNV